MNINTDSLVAREQERAGYTSMEHVYLSSLINERIALVCSSHVKRLVAKLESIGITYKLGSEYTGECSALESIYRIAGASGITSHTPSISDK